MPWVKRLRWPCSWAAASLPIWRVLPEFAAKYPMYERMGLRDLCQQIHEAYAEGDIARLTTEMYLSDLHPAMKPSEAYAYIAHRKTERVEIDQLEGRITTSLLTPYPPGIPLLIPGERFNKKICDYLRFTREFNAAFPGFGADVHGLVAEDDAVAAHLLRREAEQFALAQAGEDRDRVDQPGVDRDRAAGEQLLDLGRVQIRPLLRGLAREPHAHRRVGRRRESAPPLPPHPPCRPRPPMSDSPHS